MARADVCLGILGTSEKAGRLIPNKLFQALLAGMPLITRNSPAMRELVKDDAPANPAALLDAIERFAA